MQIHLSLRQTPNGLVYAFPLWYRLTSVCIVLILSAAISVSGGTGPLGLVVLIITILASLYEERWTIDTRTRTLTSAIGLLVMARRTTTAFDDIEDVRLDVFLRGKLDQEPQSADTRIPPGSQVRLVINLKNGDRLMPDSAAYRRKEFMVLTGTAIAGSMGVPFVE